MYNYPPPVSKGSEFKDFIPMGKISPSGDLAIFFSRARRIHIWALVGSGGVPEIFDF